MRLIILLFLFLSSVSFAQKITTAQQKALNNYVEYVNHSVGEVNSVVHSITELYAQLQSQKENKYGYRISYSCPIQLEDFYLNKAITDSKGLGALAVGVNAKLNALRISAETIDKHCKALDTYYKLEDYKQDNYKKAGALVDEIISDVQSYKQNQEELHRELASVYSKLNLYVDSNPYHKITAIMRQQIKTEQSFIDSWKFNLKEKVHTEWSIEKLSQSISDTENELKVLSSYKPAIKYPASSMLGSYTEALQSILTTKQNGLDEYNFEAKKTDRHSNEVYESLINYFNGTLVSFYNAYIGSAQADGFYGLQEMMYATAIEVRDHTSTVIVDVKPFQDFAISPFAASPQKLAITKPVYNALNNYVDFINESLRQLRYLQMVVSSLNGSAGYYKDLTSYKGKGGLSYDYKDYQIPLSLYQTTLNDSKGLPPAIAKSLNAQMEVLLNILKELDQLSAWVEMETREKRYEKDNLKKLYEILERNKILFDTYDDRKEILYENVRSAYNAFPPSNATSSWYISGKALRDLTDLDHDALFKAKAYYKGNTSITVSTEKIDWALRDVIANEYTNMKGIEKIGRNNGLCPYTPYEDLPQSSKTLSEDLSELKPPTQSSYNHPYHGMVNVYNGIVEKYNKFCELSKDVLLLKTIVQPELFFLITPIPKPSREEAPITDKQQPIPIQPTITPTKADVPVEKEVVKPPPSAAQPKNTVVHDTVYIQKRDTVYIGEPGEDLHSMEGYATNNMILLLDVSGSMNAPEKLPLLKSTVLNLITMMRAEDEVSVIVYSGKAKVLLDPTSFGEGEKIKKVVDKLKSEGKTDGNAGLKLAYKVADENYVRGGNNRIILATDGEFPLSEDTFQLVDKFSKDDIFITVFNFGKSNASARTLEKLAVTGKGNYEYINKQNAEYKLIKEVKAKRKK